MSRLDHDGAGHARGRVERQPTTTCDDRATATERGQVGTSSTISSASRARRWPPINHPSGATSKPWTTSTTIPHRSQRLRPDSFLRQRPFWSIRRPLPGSDLGSHEAYGFALLLAVANGNAWLRSETPWFSSDSSRYVKVHPVSIMTSPAMRARRWPRKNPACSDPPSPWLTASTTTPPRSRRLRPAPGRCQRLPLVSVPATRNDVQVPGPGERVDVRLRRAERVTHTTSSSITYQPRGANLCQCHSGRPSMLRSRCSSHPRVATAPA